MAKALGVGGIFFKAKDPQALLAWYQKWLGLPDESDSCSMFSPASMPEGACTVFSPFPSDTDYFARQAQDRVGYNDEQHFMISFVVDDLTLVLEQVESGGATVLGSKRDTYGSFGWFIDPEGNKVELWEPAK